MADPTWTYSDWITSDRGSSTRLTRLRLHIQEVADKVKNGSYTVQGKTHTKNELAAYLDSLRRSEADEANASGVAAEARAPFVRGRAL